MTSWGTHWGGGGGGGGSPIWHKGSYCTVQWHEVGGASACTCKTLLCHLTAFCC